MSRSDTMMARSGYFGRVQRLKVAVTIAAAESSNLAQNIAKATRSVIGLALEQS